MKREIWDSDEKIIGNEAEVKKVKGHLLPSPELFIFYQRKESEREIRIQFLFSFFSPFAQLSDSGGERNQVSDILHSPIHYLNFTYVLLLYFPFIIYFIEIYAKIETFL